MKRLWWLAIAAVAAVLVALWWGAARTPRRPDILLLTIDTLRADHLGAYGYAAAHTPNLDSLAKRGRLFLQATTPMPRTTPGLASLLSGLGPRRHGSREVDQPIASVTLLPEILKRLGYRTIGVSANPAAGPRQGLARGFDRFDVAEIPKSMDARSVTDKALELFGAASGRQRTFLWVHYDDPHAPYDPPAAWRVGRNGAACDALVRLITTPGWATGHVMADRNGVSSAALGSCLSLYDAEIAYADAEVGRLLEGLARRLDLTRTLIVFASDHGENFGEDGLFYEHGPSLHDASLHVPLVIAGPGIGSSSDAGAASLEDVVPTVLSLLRVPPDQRPALDGADLAARLRGDDRGGASEPNRIVLAEGASSLHLHDFNWLQSGAAQERHCLNVGEYSLCQEPAGRAALYDHALDPTLERDVSAAHPEVERRLAAAARIWPPETARLLAARSPRFKLVARPRPEGDYRYALYDLTLDPAERHDVAAEHPDLVRRFRGALERLTAQLPGQGHSRSETDMDRLRSLGYLR